MIKSLLFLVCVLSLASAAITEDALLNFTQLMNKYNYPYEVHQITTEDQYILTYFRIQAKNQTIVSGKPVVFLMHGLLDSAECFVYNYENVSLAYVLANKGFDVWLGNSRGNKFSKGHQTLDADVNSSYWDFSWQEMAQYDLPAAFEYIVGKTQQKINYIGHSQGTVQMFAALADQNPIIAKNLRKYAALAPVAYLSNIETTIMRIALSTPLIEIARGVGFNSMFSYSESASRRKAWICTYIPMKCRIDAYLKQAAVLDYDNTERYAVHEAHYPAGTSVKNFAHWKQLFTSGKFQKYDQGSSEKNMAKYGQATAPEYKLEDISGDIMLAVGTADLLADVKDVQLLFDRLRNSKANVTIGYYPGGHITFLVGKDLYYLDDLYKFLGY